MGERVLSFEQALEVVLDHAWAVANERAGEDGTGGQERVALAESAGRVMGRRLQSDRSYPAFSRATRDGYAVRGIAEGREFRVVGSVKAGQVWKGADLERGEAIEIMTGAPLPPWSEAVVMVEHVVVEGGRIRLAEGREVTEGDNYVPRGGETPNGLTIVKRGAVMGASAVAAAAMCGFTEVSVALRPTVAIVATGDELVELGEEVGEGQIRNTNALVLEALVRAEGAVAQRLGIARDTEESVRARVDEGRKADVLVLSGGVSVGKYDLVEKVLAEMGAEFLFTGALIQPGTPVVFGRLPRVAGGWQYFFGLPGNPVSTQVTFALFVAPMLRGMCGAEDAGPKFVEARLTDEVKGGAKVMRFVPVAMESRWDGVRVKAVRYKGSGDVFGNARAGGFMVLPVGVETFAAGDTVRVLPV